MRTIGISPGDWVLLLERRGEQEIVYNAMVASVSMDESLAGTKGEGSIRVVFVPVAERPDAGVLIVPDVVHISHRDWLEGRAGLAYEELPHPPSGVCRFCRCTQQRACAGGCDWIDLEGTVCSSEECLEKYGAEGRAEFLNQQEVQPHEASV